MKYLVLFLLMICQLACAAPREIDDHHWDGVERIIAIGDLHGDYDHYLAALQAAGLVNAKGKWSGGTTHLVQTGDVPDRGPDTVKIIEHLGKLAKEARKKGGRVHNLTGNHEAMNVYGDLRYVSAGEYEEFVNRNSTNLRDRYFSLVMQNLQQSDPAGFAALPENYRQEWDQTHPLGWVEHQQAWNTAWNPDAKFAAWVLQQKVAIQINDLVFLHGGISGFYCRNSLQSLTAMVASGLRAFDQAKPGILQDEFGPLWYRGLSGVEPVAAPETVQAVLEQHNAGHIVVGHTPTSGVIWPRYDGKVIQIDTGISAAYGGYVAYLEITPSGLFAGYPKGKIKLPADESGLVSYLEQVIALEPGNTHLQQRLARLTAPLVVVDENAAAGAPGQSIEQQTEAATEPAAEGGETAVPEPLTVPICGISE